MFLIIKNVRKNEVGSLPSSSLQPKPAPSNSTLSKKAPSRGTSQDVTCLVL